ncbi:MAG: hypothetical protein IID40_05655, partial [Planctomycetes bacterium]|nr:hypothetical protein [Planctomycetota bacterium]
MTIRTPIPSTPLAVRRLHGRGGRFGLAWGLLGTVWFVPAVMAGGDTVGAEWLVDRARDYGLATGGVPSVGDAGIMLVWMQAASRLAPDRADAYLGQHTLHILLGLAEEAGLALEQYSRLDPDDEVHALAALTRQYERARDADHRTAFCRTRLAETIWSPPIRSELHRWLAQTHRGVGETALARAHARRAVDTYAFNFSAWELLFRLDGNRPAPEDVIRRRLAVIGANPADAMELWNVAEALASLSMHEPAETYYALAIDAYARSSSRAPLPPLLLDRARSARDAGWLDRAAEFARQAVKAAPESMDARLLLIETDRRAGRGGAADESLDQLGAQIATLEDPVRRQGDGPGAARIAWYHLQYDSDPEKALEFAEIAHRGAPDDPQVRRIYGLAQRAAGQADAARTTLAPLAQGDDPDQLAAWGLAQSWADAGDADKALTVCREAEQIRRSGPAYERVVDLLEQLGHQPMPPPDRSKVLAALNAFDADVLGFPTDPGRYLELTATVLDAAPQLNQRWPCRITLKNVGPFPITVGPQQMVTGDVLVSAKVHLPETEPITGYLRASLARRHLVRPGERVELVRALDVGPLARVATLLPQRELEVTFTVILDAVTQDDGTFRSSLGDSLVVSAGLKRRPWPYDQAQLRELTRQASGGTPAQRCAAFQTVAALLAERRAAMRTRLDYQPRRVDKAT